MAQERRIFDRLRVFVSSRMDELREERAAVGEALDALKVDAWVFGANPSSYLPDFRALP